MKKKVMLAVLTACLMFSAAACSNQANDDTAGETQNTADGEESQETEESTSRLVSVEDVDKYIKIGNYKGLKLDRMMEEITEDQVNAQIESDLVANAEEVTDADAQVQDQDIVNINYVGRKDGKEFDGGSAENYDLTIGSETFIEGFEDGLVGAKKGETRSLNLTFPEEYPTEDLAGQDVVFEVTVNSITRPGELTEDWVKAHTDYKSVKEYQAAVRSEMEKAATDSALANLRNSAWSAVEEASEVKEYPAEDLQKAKEDYNSLIESYAKQSNMEMEEFLESQGTTQEQLDEQCEQYAEYKVKQNLIVQGIIDKEGLSLTDEAAEKVKTEMLEQYGVDDINTLVEQFGETSVNESVGVVRVCDYIIENADITDKIDDGAGGVLDGDAPEDTEEETTEDTVEE